MYGLNYMSLPRCGIECQIPYTGGCHDFRYKGTPCHIKCLRKYSKKYKIHLTCKCCGEINHKITRKNLNYKCSRKKQCFFCNRWRIKMVKFEKNHFCYGCILNRRNDKKDSKLISTYTLLYKDISLIISNYTSFDCDLIELLKLKNKFCKNIPQCSNYHNFTTEYCNKCNL